MTYYAETITLGQVVPYIIDKAEKEGYTAVKFPLAKNIRMTAAETLDVNGVKHAITGYLYSGSYPVYYLMAKSNSNYWVGPNGAKLESNIQYDFGDGNGQLINAYSLSAYVGDPRTLAPTAPKNWILYGSDDLLDWQPLDERKDETNWRQNEKRYFKFTNVVKYRFYKIIFSETNGSQLHLNSWDLFDLNELNSKPTQISAAYLISKGSSTSDRVNLYIDALECAVEEMSPMYLGNMMQIATVESFDLTNWKQNNMLLHGYYTCRYTTPFQNHPSVPLNIYLDVSKDRIYFATVLDQSAMYPATNAAYLGLLKRYSKEGNNDALTITVGMQSLIASPMVLRNKAGTYCAGTLPRYVTLGYSPSVWGDNIFVSPVFIEGDYEGIRGELEDVYTSRTDSLVNEDEILVGDIRYKVLLLTSYGSCGFPYYCAIFKTNDKK